MADKYEFRREDTGKIISVNFETMMTQDAAGYISLTRSGKEIIAKRVNRSTEKKQPEKVESSGVFHQVSDALGFTEHEFTKFEEDRKKNGFSGVEFTRDPDVPSFFQARFSSRKEWDRYVKHRGSIDMNGINGGSAALSEKDFEDAKRKALEKYPVKN